LMRRVAVEVVVVEVAVVEVAVVVVAPESRRRGDDVTT
jgi:hypothetical protein